MKLTRYDADVWMAAHAPLCLREWVKPPARAWAAMDAAINGHANLRIRPSHTVNLLRLVRRNIATGAHKDHKTLREYLQYLAFDGAGGGGSELHRISARRFLRSMEEA